VGRKRKETPAETVGQRIARLRHERGLTQTELAEMIGTIQTAISEYELDKVRVHSDVLVRLAQAFRVTADELLGLTGLPEGGTVKNRRLRKRLEEIDRLPKRDQQALLRTIDAFLQKAS
jgi:transcriptional regulator with XRE-family HTH domain